MAETRVQIEVPKALRVRVLWGASPICDVVLQPPRGFSLGEAGDFLLPESALGGRSLPWIRVRDGRIRVAVRSAHALGMEGLTPDPDDATLAWLELLRGQSFSQSLGAFTLEVNAEEPVRSPVRRFHVGTRGLGYFVGSLFAIAGALALARAVAAPEEVYAQMQAEDRLYFMRAFLAAKAERETEREGRTGVRAKGEEGGMGHARFGVRGPDKGARSAALREAAEFGLVGLSAPMGSDALGARGVPWGRDLALSAPSGEASGGEEYGDFGINPALDPSKDRLSTFAIDVDTGSYNLAKRKIEEGILPPLHAVRVEEFVNAFDGGEIGAGHTVTALYDMVLKNTRSAPVTVHVRQKPAVDAAAVESAFAMAAGDIAPSFRAASPDLRFAVAVAAFAEVLRGSPAALGWKLDGIESIARAASLDREERVELAELVGRAAELRRLGG